MADNDTKFDILAMWKCEVPYTKKNNLAFAL